MTLFLAPSAARRKLLSEAVFDIGGSVRLPVDSRWTGAEVRVPLRRRRRRRARCSGGRRRVTLESAVPAVDSATLPASDGRCRR